jgi:hypothetical protein
VRRAAASLRRAVNTPQADSSHAESLHALWVGRRQAASQSAEKPVLATNAIHAFLNVAGFVCRRFAATSTATAFGLLKYLAYGKTENKPFKSG